MKKYVVVNNFLDKTDNRKLYTKDDFYTHKDSDRINLLLDKGFIRELQKKPPESKIKHVGGGYYELPNGERIQGKEEAIKALESGE
jgi:hypothetical protein